MAGALLVTACSWGPLRDLQDFFLPGRGAPTLQTALRQYEAGSYTEAMGNLQSAMALGLSKPDRVRAHKHLAFIHCVADRVPACREEFRKALAIDAKLELPPEEAGHPVWGPVFRSLKSSR
jgi:Tfp pilus assembly protein PilF